MKEKFLHLPFSKAKTQSWSGGETTELFILPHGADFNSGEYSIRISVATVTQEKSVYTQLENVQRTLLLLEGTLELDHKGHHSKRLKPFDQDFFSAEWVTQSRGKVVNFNVLLKTGSAEVKHHRLFPNEKLKFEKEGQLTFLFVANGKMEIGGVLMEKYDAIVLEDTLEIKAALESDLVSVVYA